jgi:serine O-acetyltransferase
MNLFESIREDTRVVLERDPAASSLLMVLTCYPGLHAVPQGGSISTSQH